MKRTMHSLILLALFLVISACRLENQNPKDVFTNKKLPPMLDKVANEHWDLKRNEKLIRQLIERNQNQDRLLIGVIDNGMDIFHPELIRVNDWQLNDKGEITTGFDPVGEQKFASSTYINPKLFAFGAEDIIDGKIHNPVENPLDLLAEIDAVFHQKLAEQIAFSKVDLKDTIFMKIQPGAYTIFDALRLVEESKPGLIEKFETRKEAGKLLPHAFKNRKIPDALRASHDMLKEFSDLYEPSWDRKNMRENPLMSKQFWWMQDADVFFDIIKAAVDETVKATELDRHVMNYQLFASYADQSPAERKKFVDGFELKTVAGALETGLEFKLHGPMFKHPLRRFAESMREWTLEEKLLLSDRVSLPATITTEEVIEFMVKRIEFRKSELLRAVENPDDLLAKVKAQDQRLYLKQMDVMLKYLMEKRELSFDGILSKIDQDYENQTNRDRRFTHHPFVSSKARGKSHSAHVAGAIANGNRNDIILSSLRPLTESMDVSYEESIRLARDFEKNFKEFLQNPVVTRGLKSLLKQYDLVVDGMTQKQIVNEVMKLSKVHAARRAKNSPLDFLFVNHIVETVEEVGRRGILFSNVSLGYEFNKKPDTAEKTDPTKKLFDFLAFEFFKWKVSKTIVEKAPNSMFFVAAGNSGAWIDGLSKSALPFDLTSTFFARFETDSQKLPNHMHKNIVGVMSAGDHNLLSSFTNLAIHKNVPVIVGHGEDVLSMVRRTDQSYNSTIWGEYRTEAQDGLETIAPSVKDKREMLIRYYGKEQFEKLEKIMTANSKYGPDMMLMGWVFGLEAPHQFVSHAFSDDLKTRYPMQRSRYNGTSMATPNALQVVVKHTVEKARKMGVPLKSVTGQKGFRPHEILEDIAKITRPLSDDVYLIPLDYVDSTKMYRPDETEKALRAELSILPQKKGQKRGSKRDRSPTSAINSCSKSAE